MPTEHSWHGMGPWYHNAFDVMQNIPVNENGSIYHLALSRPGDFGIFPYTAQAQFYAGFKSNPKMFRMNTREFIAWPYVMLKAWKPFLKDTAYKTWRSCFGPWIGSDWSKISLHTTGDCFRK